MPKLPVEEWWKRLQNLPVGTWLGELKNRAGDIDWKNTFWKALEICREKLPDGKGRKFLGAGLAAVFLFFLGSCFFGGETEKGSDDANSKQTVYLRVKPGMSANDIGKLLEKHGVIESHYKFWFNAKMNGDEGKFKTGTYAFHQDMEAQEVLEALVEGRTSSLRFTIPEGFTVEDIARRLSEEGLADEQEFLDKAKTFAPYRYIKRDRRARYYAEGFLFPDTYELTIDATTEDILDMMAKDFDDRLTEEMRDKAESMGISIYELVTLASMVEKEARFEEDRAIIAQVFWKRLELGMPLQSDTTLQYLLDAPKEDLSIADTEMNSPYNTYQHTGLPPGPVANPGTACIEAVLYPAQTDYLYFVADRQGHNHYSYTYDEHMEIVGQVR